MADTKKLTEEQVKYMADRFLGWRLPENFNPDGGVSFKPLCNPGTEHETKNRPTGTNLLDATQAEAMVHYMIDGMPVAAPSPATEHVHRWVGGGDYGGHVGNDICADCGVENYGTDEQDVREQHQSVLIAAAYRDAAELAIKGVGGDTYENSIDCGNSGDVYQAGRNDEQRALHKLLSERTPAHARAAFEEELRKAKEEALSPVRMLLNNWIQLRDVKGDVTRLYAIGELENALRSPREEQAK
jgi:hypothetical protein